MANLFQKRKLLFAVLAGIFVLLITIIPAINIQNQKSQDLSTPALLDQALGRGEIISEQQLLYLAYAVYEPESLPAQFRSNVGWHATSIVEELNAAVGSPSILCSMSPYVQSEFQRLFNPDTTCE